MKLTVLVDNNTLIDRYFIGEPGVSYHLQTAGQQFLFDTGYSDVFIQNARKMDLDLRELDGVILSHGHLDHTWGLPHLIRLLTEAGYEGLPVKKPRLIAHPAVFHAKSLGTLSEINSMLPAGSLTKHFDLKLQKEPLWLTEDLVYLGEIPRENAFEALTPIGKTDQDGQMQDDFVMDDTALAFKTSQGFVLIAGCAHAGICNTLEYAKTVVGDSRVVDVIGGFHLQAASAFQLSETVNYMRSLKPGSLHACHCTDLNAKIALAKAASLQEVGVGLVLRYPERGSL